MSIPIVNDHGAIRRRMQEIQAGDFALPTGIYIMLPDETPREQIMKGRDTIFALHANGQLQVYYAYHRELVGQRMRELENWLAELLSARPTAWARDTLHLTERDCERLINTLTRMRRPLL